VISAIHQFHDGTAVGDAVTNDMLEIQGVLRKNGFRSEIFATHIAVGLRRKIRAFDTYRGDQSALMVVHHSMGFDRMERLVSLPDRKILKYHNITPPELLSNNHAKAYATKGRTQLMQYRPHVELALGDSEYNRRELQEIGFRYTGVLPIFYRSAILVEGGQEHALARKLKGTFNLLFVGRIVPNKKQLDLVGIFDHYYRNYNAKSRLWLVGSSDGSEAYRDEIVAEISRRGLSECVSLTGKISSSQLATYYRNSDVLLCASEHEGFCLPLLEAMEFELPVVAFAMSAVPETLGSAGILLESKTPELWCEVIEELRKNTHLRENLISRGHGRLSELSLENAEAKLLDIIRGLDTCSPIDVRKLSLQVQGPFESSYSLSEVNRSLAVELDKSGRFDVSIYCTEGPGDYRPNEASLADKPQAKWLWQKSTMMTGSPDVVIRNLYPPRVDDVNGRLNLLYLAWEDSLLPRKWAESFNRSIDIVLAPTHHVKQVMLNSGVTLPTHVVGEGISERFFEADALWARTRKHDSFTFLNISSGFPRKGIDVLLEAYFTEFTAPENVRLVLKTFPNPHNEVAAQIDEIRKKISNPPLCIHLDCDLPPEEIDQLYAEADCLVYPTRAEGFGLPIAEAIACKLPVIATRYSGLMDFCSDDTTFFVNYDLVPSRSHLAVPGAMWAEPRINALREQMRFVFTNRHSKEVRQRVEAGYQNAKENLRWSRVANQVEEIAIASLNKPARKLAMVTTWDSRCGIAEYSRYFIEALAQQHGDFAIEVLSPSVEHIWPKNDIVNTVCWEQRPSTDLSRLRATLLEDDFDIVHFQFNFGFFELPHFAALLESLKDAGLKVIITFHSTADIPEPSGPISLKTIANSLRGVDLLLVHSPYDEKRLAEFGLQENVRIFPHGNIIYPMEDRSLRQKWGINLDPVIGTFGFLLPHKGIIELLEAIAILRLEYPEIGLMAQCALHQNSISRDFEGVVKQRIRELNLSDAVLMSTNFLEPEEAMLFLQLTDIIVLPYKDTRESSSASVRFALGSGRPVITTKNKIFSDVTKSTLQVESASPRDLANAIRKLLKDFSLADRLAQHAARQIETTSWQRVSKLYVECLV
jgi:glycosyltransferase involved in cell wall biosynthesis